MKKQIYWVIAVTVLAISCLLLLIVKYFSKVIVVKYYVKRGLATSCLLSYQYND